MSETDNSPNLEKLIGNQAYLEGPRWHDGRIWVSDFYKHEVLGVSPEGSVEVSIDVPDTPSGLGWMQDGRMLIAQLNTGQLITKENPGELRIHADLTSHTSTQINDMVVDTNTDRAYVSPFGFNFFGADPSITGTELIQVTSEGKVETFGDNLMFPNGLVISPDGNTLIVAESLGCRITAFDINEDGLPTNQRIWADFGSTPATKDLDEFLEEAAASGLVTPDGIALDAEGSLWVADVVNQRAVRVREGGEITNEINYDKHIQAVMLGGDDGRTLYLCTSPTLEDVAALNACGSEIVTTRVDIGHAGQP